MNERMDEYIVRLLKFAIGTNGRRRRRCSSGKGYEVWSESGSGYESVCVCLVQIGS